MSDYLEHHGIKNQRWYHRRFQNADGSLTPAGKERYGEWKPGQYKKTKLNVVRDDDGRKKYKIESEDGTSVGDITTTHQSGEALRVNWISVNKDHKREGYASSAMNSLIQDAKERGYKKVTVVIPTGSKDVQHIYERLGFTASKEGLTTDEIADSITSLGDVVKLEYSLEHSDFLEHYGVGHLQGGHSGRYPWGSGKNGANRRVFVSGSSKTQFEDNPYYRKELPKPIRDELDKMVADSANIIVGDAPGIDRQVQDYLKTLNYENVSVYGPGKKLRYLANENWTARPIDAPEFEPMSPEWLAKKDIAMEKAATEGLAVILDEGANATRNNIKRLQESGKEVKVYELNKVSAELDHWVDKLLDELKHEDEDGNYLEHYGKGHDDSPPGRGSGRYAWGSGKRPHQHDTSDRYTEKTGIFSKTFGTKNEKQKDHYAAEEKAKQTAEAILKIANAHSSGYANPSEYLGIPAVKEIAEDEGVKRARKKMEDNDMLYPDYRKNQEYYATMAAHVDWKLRKSLYEGTTMTIEDNVFHYLHEDGDQGDFNSFSCYLIDHGVDVNGYGVEARDAHQEYEETINIHAGDLLGKYADEHPKNSWLSVKDILRDAVEEYHDDGDKNFYFGWYDAELSDDGEKQLDEVKRIIKEFKDEEKVKHSEDIFEDFLRHYGVGPDDNPPGRGSGRYAKGSGERPFQHDPVMQNASNRRRKKWGIFERIRQRREEAAKEHAEYAKKSEEDRQLTEAKNKAEALKKKRLEALNKARAIKKANADKAATEKAAKEKYEAEKKEAIDSGDPEKIAKYLKDLTNQEQIDAINRIGNTAKIKALADEQKRAFKAAEDARIAAEKALEEANRPRTKAEIREQKFNEAISKIQNASNKLDKLRDSGEKIIKFYNMAASVNNALNDKVKLPKIDLGPNQKKDGDKKDKQDGDKKEKDKQQNNGGSKSGDTYNTTHDSHDTYNTYNNYGWDDYTERFYKQYQDQPNSGEWKAYESQGLLLLEDFSKRKK